MTDGRPGGTVKVTLWVGVLYLFLFCTLLSGPAVAREIGKIQRDLAANQAAFSALMGNLSSSRASMAAVESQVAAADHNVSDRQRVQKIAGCLVKLNSGGCGIDLSIHVRRVPRIWPWRVVPG